MKITRKGKAIIVEGDSLSMELIAETIATFYPKELTEEEFIKERDRIYGSS